MMGDKASCGTCFDLLDGVFGENKGSNLRANTKLDSPGVCGRGGGELRASAMRSFALDARGGVDRIGGAGKRSLMSLSAFAASNCPEWVGCGEAGNSSAGEHKGAELNKQGSESCKEEASSVLLSFELTTDPTPSSGVSSPT